MAKRTRVSVGSPLNPEKLLKLGVIENLSVQDLGFVPESNWENTYRIWTCHGYKKRGNANDGYLQIRKNVDKPEDFTILTVHQKVVNQEGIFHLIDAEISCRNDILSFPVKWKLSSRFIDPGGREISDLYIEQKGKVSGTEIIVKTKNYTSNQKLTNRLTSDFCLVDAIQRLTFEQNIPFAFDVLEGMSLLKRDHHMSYQGTYPLKINGKEISLYRLSRLGFGILPYDYFLDKNHRLQIVISASRTYILDADAEKKVNLHLKSKKERYLSKKNKYQESEENNYE